MKTFFLTVALVSSFTFFSCDNKDNVMTSNIADDVVNSSYDVMINSVERINNSDIEAYKKEASDNPEFNYKTKNVVSGYFPNYTKAYTDTRECIYFESEDTSNRLLGFYIDKDNGAKKAAIFDYKIENNKLLVNVLDLNYQKQCYIELDLETKIGTVIDLYNNDNLNTKFGGCNVGIYAAGIPWAIGFGMVNPIAGIVAGTVFWALEHIAC